MCACGPALKALWLHVRTKPAVRKFTARVSEQGSALFMFLYRPCPTRRWPRGNATERDIAQAHQRRDSAWLAKVQGLDGSTGDYDGTKSFATVVHATDCGWWTRGQDAGPAGKDGWDTDTGSSEATDYSSRLGQFWSGHAGPVGPCAVIMVGLVLGVIPQEIKADSKSLGNHCGSRRASTSAFEGDGSTSQC